jgi:hypothetical protein
MGALERMKPKPHEEMNLSKSNNRASNLKRNASKDPDKGKSNRPKAGGQTE